MCEREKGQRTDKHTCPALHPFHQFILFCPVVLLIPPLLGGCGEASPLLTKQVCPSSPSLGPPLPPNRCHHPAMVHAFKRPLTSSWQTCRMSACCRVYRPCPRTSPIPRPSRACPLSQFGRARPRHAPTCCRPCCRRDACPRPWMR